MVKPDAAEDSMAARCVLDEDTHESTLPCPCTHTHKRSSTRAHTHAHTNIKEILIF
jgi:hypothetical protein